MLKRNPIRERATEFAVRIIKMCRTLKTRRIEREILSQVLRSGTSIGANISEAQGAFSRADFKNKMQIAFKEATETEYWLNLLFAIDGLTEAEYNSLNHDCQTRLRILSVITKKLARPEDEPNAPSTER